jgi:hypothetical protein
MMLREQFYVKSQDIKQSCDEKKRKKENKSEKKSVEPFFSEKRSFF